MHGMCSGPCRPRPWTLALLIGRLALAGVFLAHGIRHIFGGGKIAGTARWFESLGMRPGIVHAWVASLTEVGAGALLILGLLTPVACAGVVGVMLVAWITNHLKNGFFIFRPGEGWEYVMTLTVVGILIGTLGPGDWSVDAHLFHLEQALGLARLRHRLRRRGPGLRAAPGHRVAAQPKLTRPGRRSSRPIRPGAPPLTMSRSWS